MCPVCGQTALTLVAAGRRTGFTLRRAPFLIKDLEVFNQRLRAHCADTEGLFVRKSQEKRTHLLPPKNTDLHNGQTPGGIYALGQRAHRAIGMSALGRLLPIEAFRRTPALDE